MYERRLILLGITLILFSSLSIPTILQTVLAQTANFLTYENPTYGFRIQYPSDWNITSSHTEYLDNSTEEGTTRSVVEFESPDGSSFNIYVQLNTTQYLDTNTLTVKNRTAHDYVLERLAAQSDIPGFTFKNIRDYATIVADIPAWSLERISTSVLGINYIKETYVVKDDKMYNLWSSSKPLLVPTILPIAQKMIDSFELIK